MVKFYFIYFKRTRLAINSFPSTRDAWLNTCMSLLSCEGGNVLGSLALVFCQRLRVDVWDNGWLRGRVCLAGGVLDVGDTGGWAESLVADRDNNAMRLERPAKLKYRTVRDKWW